MKASVKAGTNINLKRVTNIKLCFRISRKNSDPLISFISK